MQCPLKLVNDTRCDDGDGLVGDGSLVRWWFIDANMRRVAIQNVYFNAPATSEQGLKGCENHQYGYGGKKPQEMGLHGVLTVR